MATFGELQSALQTDLHRSDTDFVVRARQAIVNAIRHYRAKGFTWNEKRVEMEVSLGVEYVSLSSDYVAMERVTLYDGADRYPLYRVTDDEIEERHRDVSDTGLPVWYAMTGKHELRLHPPTDATYSLQTVYLYDLPEITASASDAATNAWLDEGYELVKLHAMVELAVEYIHGEEMAAAAARWKQMELDVYRQLQSRTGRAQSSGRIAPHL